MHSHPPYKWFKLGGLGRIPVHSTRIPDPGQLKVVWGACWSALIVLPLILVSPAGCTEISTIRQFSECVDTCNKTHRTDSARQACYKSCEERKTFEWGAMPRSGDRSEDAEREKSGK